MINLLLVTITFILTIKIKSLLINKNTTPKHIQTIKTTLTNKNIESIIHIKTLHLKPKKLLITTKITINTTKSTTDITLTINTTKQQIQTTIPIAQIIYLKPNIHQPASTKPITPKLAPDNGKIKTR